MTVDNAELGDTPTPEGGNEPPDLGGAEQFWQLGPDERKQYRKAALQMIRLVEGYSIPIIFAPPVSMGGIVNGATGCILELGGRHFLLTASHVLGGYERRKGDGEQLNFQLGAMPPFDPLPRIAWRSSERDLVFLRLTKDEAETAWRTNSRITPILNGWPPPSPIPGQVVLVAGFPAPLRNVDVGAIGSGPLGAMFRVCNVRDGYCDCQIEDRDLVNFRDGPLPPPDADMGGLSGGPVFVMGTISYPLVGVVTEVCTMSFAEFRLLRIATLDGIAESDLV